MAGGHETATRREAGRAGQLEIRDAGANTSPTRRRSCAAPPSAWTSPTPARSTPDRRLGALLADLGHQPLVTHLAATIDTGPTGGTTMRDHVAAAVDPDAPTLARAVLDDLVAVAPATAAGVDARLTVTLDPAPRPSPPGHAALHPSRH